ncbi:MAG: hypothetical protein BWX80_03658 [Candidatus Hydrogenedentes bacterium ADurb.Bin101]|nr:MAG: hypothetical protein BWX80_03658 [Candidatus Hydrogenedentes bacterium ADurb.Bin101]
MGLQESTRALGAFTHDAVRKQFDNFSVGLVGGHIVLCMLVHVRHMHKRPIYIGRFRVRVQVGLQSRYTGFIVIVVQQVQHILPGQSGPIDQFIPFGRCGKGCFKRGYRRFSMGQIVQRHSLGITQLCPDPRESVGILLPSGKIFARSINYCIHVQNKCIRAVPKLDINCRRSGGAKRKCQGLGCFLVHRLCQTPIQRAPHFFIIETARGINISLHGANKNRRLRKSGHDIRRLMLCLEEVFGGGGIITGFGKTLCTQVRKEHDLIGAFRCGQRIPRWQCRFDGIQLFFAQAARSRFPPQKAHAIIRFGAYLRFHRTLYKRQ